MAIRKTTDIEAFHEILPEQDDIQFENQTDNLEDFTNDLFEALDTLDEIHKTVFLLHYREDFSLKDIGQTLEISEGTVKSRLFYARKKLSERLVKYRKTLIDNI